MISTKGEWIIKPKFDNRIYFDQDGLGEVKVNNKTGYINKKGEWIIKPIFDDIDYFRDKNITTVEIDDKVGVIDKNSNWVLKTKFNSVVILDDLIYVKFGNYEGYTTLDGTYLTFTESELENILMGENNN